MYSKCAELSHLLRGLVKASSIPLSAAVVAVPIRKL